MTEQEVHSNPGSLDHWNILGRQVYKSEFAFLAQTVIVYIVVITSLLNLSLGNQRDDRVWVALLSSGIGYLLPNPSLRKR